MKHSLIFSALMLPGLLMLPLFGEQKELPLDTPYSDIDTGVIFPAKLGKFSKTETRISTNPVVGTLIRYNSSRANCSAAIYIYALEENPAAVSKPEFQKHFKQAARTVLNLKNLSSRIEGTEAVRQWEIPDKHHPVRRELFYLQTDGGETCRSELLMVLWGTRVVKLRVTVPADKKDAVRESDEFIGRFLKLFFPEKIPQTIEIPMSKIQD